MRTNSTWILIRISHRSQPAYLLRVQKRFTHSPSPFVVACIS